MSSVYSYNGSTFSVMHRYTLWDCLLSGYKRPLLHHYNSGWLCHRCAPVMVTNITYMGNLTFTVATPAFKTTDPDHHTIAHIIFNFCILSWGRVIKYTLIIYMKLSRLEQYTRVSYCSKIDRLHKKWYIWQTPDRTYWNIYVIYHTISSDWFVVAY